MMNRFSLQFQDKSLEEKYQEFQLVHKRKPLAKTLICLIFIIIIIQGAISIVNSNTRGLYVSLAYLIANVLFLFIFLFLPKYLRQGLIMISALFMFQYLTVEEGKTQFHYQLASAVILAIQFVIVSTGEFYDALIQIVSIFLVYLVFFIKFQQHFSYSILASVFMVIYLLINSFYTNATAERSKFQLTLLEEQWNNVLNNSIQSPTLIFSFDLIEHAFILKKSIHFNFICNNTEELRIFLRNAQINSSKTTLEQYIYRKLNQLKLPKQYEYNQQLLINFKKEIKEIVYSIFPGASPLILIQISKQQYQQQNNIIETQYQYKYLTLLKILSISFKHQFKWLKIENSNKIKKIILYRCLLEKLTKTQMIEVFNFQNVLQQLTSIYKNKEIYLSTTISFIKSYKIVVILMLIEIFESINSKQIIISIENCQNYHICKFKIFGVLTEKSIRKLKHRLLNEEQYILDIEVDEQYVQFSMMNIFDYLEVEGERKLSEINS